MKSPRRYLPRLALAASLAVAALPAAQAATGTFFFSNTPYLSAANIPAGFYLGGAPTLLENFEDAALDATLTGSRGALQAPGGLTDSVDGDDGAINGNGSGGRSWFAGGSGPVTFTFVGSGPLPTAFGLVWTDGNGSFTFSAIAGDNSPLGSITQTLGDGSSSGTTAEDRFFGVQFAGGIKSITITGASMEIDHVQYGTMVPVPEPASAALLLAGLAVLARRRLAAEQR